jgi:hypothetical protein
MKFLYILAAYGNIVTYIIYNLSFMHDSAIIVYCSTLCQVCTAMETVCELAGVHG